MRLHGLPQIFPHSLQSFTLIPLSRRKTVPLLKLWAPFRLLPFHEKAIPQKKREESSSMPFIA